MTNDEYRTGQNAGLTWYALRLCERQIPNFQLHLVAYHDRLPGEGHPVADRELLPFALFHGVIEENPTLADGPLGLPAASRQAAKFQELAEFNGCFGNDDGTGLV
jgi:hypothetical protein